MGVIAIKHSMFSERVKFFNPKHKIWPSANIFQ